jgi:hypothetical protein
LEAEVEVEVEVEERLSFANALRASSCSFSSWILSARFCEVNEPDTSIPRLSCSRLVLANVPRDSRRLRGARYVDFLNIILKKSLDGVRMIAEMIPIMAFMAMLLGSMPKNTADAANCPKMRHSRQISRCGRVKLSLGLHSMMPT